MSQWVQKISDHITGIPRSRYECVMICSHKRVGVTLQATVKFRLYMGNIMYWGLLTLNIISFFSLFSLACASSKTYNLQRVFLRIYDTNWGKSCQAFLAETVETWKKNRCMIEATHVLRRNIKFRAFPKRVGPRILSLQSVDFFGTSEHKWVGEKKKNNLD